jgi:hypothetical protein
MELAAMLAGEPFTDRPRAVCPVIGAMLREYNDALDDDRRQDLYLYASKIVGTRSTLTVERQRIARCMSWVAETRLTRGRFGRAMDRVLLFGDTEEITAERMAARIARTVGRPNDRVHRSMLALIDELCRIGARPAVGSPAASTDQPQSASELLSAAGGR